MPAKVPPVNATLTRIWTREETGIDPYGNPLFEDVETFSGAAPAYVTEKNDFEIAADGGQINNYVATVVIPSTIAVEIGHKITYGRRGHETTRQVDALEDRSDFGFTRLFVKETG